ncbi:MAG: DUF309 domain-containing protein [Chloroflexi bacterium]|nr:DUF309 domain-containing protein [Chloroflexota bacterium]
MNTHSKTDTLNPEARKGIELFNQGNYIDAHEHLETAWMETVSPERDLYQGILQIGLAYYQITRGNYRGALKMFKRGQRNLGSLEDLMLGIQIAQLRDNAKIIEDELRQLGPENIKNIDHTQFQPVCFI